MKTRIRLPFFTVLGLCLLATTGCISNDTLARLSLKNSYVTRVKPGETVGEVTFLEARPILTSGMSPTLSAWTVGLFDPEKQKFPGDLTALLGKTIHTPAGQVSHLSFRLPPGIHRFRVYYAGQTAKELAIQVTANQAKLVHIGAAKVGEARKLTPAMTLQGVDLFIDEAGTVPLHTGPDALNVLQEHMAKSPDADFRWKAVEELRRLGDRRAIPALQQAATNDADGLVRHFAGEAAVILQSDKN